jgi:hypothetical protein
VPRINLSQYQFTLRDPYHPGDTLGLLEANILNYHRSDLIRKIVSKWVSDAERDAPDGVLTIAQLDKLADDISQFDAKYGFGARDEPRLPAFDHLLRSIAIREVTSSAPSHLLPDFERRVELTMRLPENREKARRQLVAGIKSILQVEEVDG